MKFTVNCVYGDRPRTNPFLERLSAKHEGSHPEAEKGIRTSFQYIHERAPLNAARWLQGLYDQIDTLERLPERCAFARERQYLEEDLRQLSSSPSALSSESTRLGRWYTYFMFVT